MGADTSSIPTPPASQFLSHLAEHPQTPTRELVQPYLDYETWLRKAFAGNQPSVDSLAGLVPIYAGHETLFKTRGIDRREADEEKYLMRLPDNVVQADGTSAIATSLDEYRRNFEAFTHGVLADLDWSNVVVAGSAALLPLLSRRDDVKVNMSDDPGVEDPLEAYYQAIAGASDIDVFIYGLDNEDTAINRILELEAAVRKKQRLLPNTAISLRSKNAITFISPRWPYRHVQVYSNPRGITAIATRTNTVDLTRRSPSYENRLWKYRNQNFDVFWGPLDRSQIQKDYIKEFAEFDEDAPNLGNLQGLARLIYSEIALSKDRSRPYYRKRFLKKFDDGGEPALTPSSGYASHDIPYGERFTADRVRKYVERHSTEPYLFGTIEEVLVQGDTSGKKKKKKLAGKVTFLKDDPGRQMIGSFHPLTDDDWTKMAYNGSEDNEEEQ
ncbi:hypothetical protein M406DRAFT_107219 [Cryphonectria parasitica EP155]|uniref:Uncharacterized protein n=1 Tax=Cryphonectria parasitica (strain ATCC 38755 / EP155) TaxID=660469 RepID=A0A9P4Y1D5_CRYP1|nr:uncharacterized protein M406DRAFT_107219 [Cryphonectria parasitica EP155]KAF3764592.1 hypothetical protein M406DRAFT_107219 [Cryphonectria parasitica EP155]